MPVDMIRQLFTSTSDAVFGIDTGGKIRFWNSACEKLFGLSFEEVEDGPCHHVVAGKDLSGKPLCRPDCETAGRIARGLPSKHYDLLVEKKEGEAVLVNVGAYPSPLSRSRRSDIAGYLVLRQVNCDRLLQRMPGTGGALWHNYSTVESVLTRRELQILKLASNGCSTTEIADQLHICTVTVRNHFKNIFCKLNVHSRAEAISVALRGNLIA